MSITALQTTDRLPVSLKLGRGAGAFGVRREGAYTALCSFVEKVSAAIGPLIIGIALSLANFDTSLAPDVPQGGNVDTALLLAVSWLPTLFGMLAIYLLAGYRLTKANITGEKIGTV